MRAIRTREFLYIRNFEPNRWPAGTPESESAYLSGSWYGDVDNGPTKTYMIDTRDRDDRHRQLLDIAFSKRPAEERFDVGTYHQDTMAAIRIATCHDSKLLRKKGVRNHFPSGPSGKRP